jgi:hypothetical protein
MDCDEKITGICLFGTKRKRRPDFQNLSPLLYSFLAKNRASGKYGRVYFDTSVAG